jgi:hypothetical protein
MGADNDRAGGIVRRYRGRALPLGNFSIFESSRGYGNSSLADRGHRFPFCGRFGMASKTLNPLTPEEAKERLRRAARDVGLSAWVKRQPYESMMLALAAGVVLGSPHARDLITVSLTRLIKRSLNQ